MSNYLSQKSIAETVLKRAKAAATFTNWKMSVERFRGIGLVLRGDEEKLNKHFVIAIQPKQIQQMVMPEIGYRDITRKVLDYIKQAEGQL